MSLSQLPAPGTLSKYTICTSSTHPASPNVGDKLYETDTGNELTYQSATTLWTPPWNMPWGQVQAPTTWTTSTTVAGALADITNATVTFTVIGHRRYRHVITQTAIPSGATGQLNLSVTDAANTGQGVPATRFFGGLTAGSSLEVIVTEVGLAAGSISRKMRGICTVAGNCQVYADATGNTAVWTIYDDGPNGAPL